MYVRTYVRMCTHCIGYNYTKKVLLLAITAAGEILMNSTSMALCTPSYSPERNNLWPFPTQHCTWWPYYKPLSRGQWSLSNSSDRVAFKHCHTVDTFCCRRHLKDNVTLVAVCTAAAVGTGAVHRVQELTWTFSREKTLKKWGQMKKMESAILFFCCLMKCQENCFSSCPDDSLFLGVRMKPPSCFWFPPSVGIPLTWIKASLIDKSSMSADMRGFSCCSWPKVSVLLHNR